MIHEICMVKPATGRKIDCYFTTGHVRRFDMDPLLKPDCGPVFKPLRNRKTFLDTMTVINGTLAFDVAGGRNEYKCVDIDPETIFEQGEPVKSIIRAHCEKPTGGTTAKLPTLKAIMAERECSVERARTLRAKLEVEADRAHVRRTGKHILAVVSACDLERHSELAVQDAVRHYDERP